MLCTHKTASSASLVLEICPNFANPYLTQFSSISGGNCIMDQSLDSAGIRDNANDKTGYNLRTSRQRSYKHLYDPNVFETNKNNDDLGGVVMTTINGGSVETGQMSMRKGLKVFGEPGYAAVKKEMQQLHDRNVMQPVNRKDLSPSQKKEALGYLMFLKKKRCGAIKGRGCADRSVRTSPRKSRLRPPFPPRPCS